MKVCVCAQVTYFYNVNINGDFVDSDIIYCDSADPVYGEICKLMNKEQLVFDGKILSIVDEDESGTLLYSSE